ncbi:DUF2279 domain-containing protein [Owenweeksia hongkongensis]|uniref:DUF2279 domain-containing protein n=1 Tax=Owenweeksia hongkongensis TaxID=253245 RepID=UPI003A90B0AC
MRFSKAITVVFLAACMLPTLAFAQLWSDSLSFFEKSPSLNKKRVWTVAGTEAALVAGTYVGLNQLWYADYPKSDFHLYNDNSSWLQMDKAGHAMTSYYVGYAGMEVLKWSGVSDKKSVWYGGTLGFAYLAGIEVMDGFSSEWGFSWGDIAANGAGAALLIGQELLWQEQRITMKFSYHGTSYAEVSPDLLGNSWSTSILKDYNGQTYWLSFNVHDLTGWNAWPQWLNVAAGYGADGMVSAQYNSSFYEVNPEYKWQRQFYASLDIDLRKIPVKNKFLKSVLNTINFIKVPMPTIEWNQKGSPEYYWLYF